MGRDVVSGGPGHKEEQALALCHAGGCLQSRECNVHFRLASQRILNAFYLEERGTE